MATVPIEYLVIAFPDGKEPESCVDVVSPARL